MARSLRASGPKLTLTPRASRLPDYPPFAQRLESHPWFKAGRLMDGEAAREYLIALRECSRDQPRPYCIYVHVPFCASICRYCALYTRAVRGGHADAVFDEYLERGCQAIAVHSQVHGGHGPTTVHFGGGTPLHLGLTRFAALTRALREAFGNPAGCEWALETTTSSLNPDVVAALAALGFQRIHLGIQTLDNRLRQHYRRHESGEAAIEKIQYLQQQGFRYSVDLIIGFADSTAAILQDDLRRLFDAGVRMFSICELRQRQGQELTARQHQAQSQRNYQLWTTVWRFMERVGLRPIHLGQFARSQEDNLYYTHPARGEDCIAIGPYAHGSAGRLYYSNLLLPDYYAAVRTGVPPIDRAVLYDDRTETLRDLERELLAHRVRPPTLDHVVSNYPAFTEILAFWQARQLLLQSGDRSAWAITQEGSWFIGNMIAQARQMAEPGEDIARHAPPRQAAANPAMVSP